MTTRLVTRALAGAALASAISISSAIAAGGHAGGHVGQPATSSAASRTVEVVMGDSFYEPETISVKAGETVRFVVRNKGELVHEFNIGTAAMHAAHQKEMMMMVDHGVLGAFSIDREAAKAMQASMGHGMHADPNSVLLEPGKTGEVVWTFPEDAELQFACNVPGHYDAGMQGNFRITH